MEGIRDETLKKLDAITDENNPARDIFWSYQELERLARRMQCLYINSSGAVIFTREMAEYERLSKPWIDTIDFKPF